MARFTAVGRMDVYQLPDALADLDDRNPCLPTRALRPDSACSAGAVRHPLPALVQPVVVRTLPLRREETDLPVADQQAPAALQKGLVPPWWPPPCNFAHLLYRYITVGYMLHF